MEEQRRAKQNFLHEEIVEKNFSPQEFMEFCDEFKGADIDAYALEELKAIVAKFQRTKLKPLEKILNNRTGSLDDNSLFVPEANNEPSVRSMSQATFERSPEFLAPKPKLNSPYAIQAINQEENVLSAEGIVTVILEQ